MEKIKIYTFSHNRPDFIELQYNSIKKHIKDNFEYIVFNNEFPGGDGGFNLHRSEQIKNECQRLGIRCIYIEFDPKLQILNNRLVYQNNAYMGGAAACAYSLSWAWQNFISKDPGIIIVIDSDMFFCKDISIKNIMKNYNFGYCPSYRKNHEVKYPWNGIIFADIPNMPNPHEMTWGDGIVDGIATDVGGELHYYLKKYKNELKQLYIDIWGYLVDTEDYVEISTNGCAQYYINFTTNDIQIRDPRTIVYSDNTKAFPHQKERNNYWNYFYQNCFYLKKFADECKFPKPSYFDLIKLENSDLLSDSFIIHYKSGSNYQPWASEQYNKQKTEILKTFLNK